MIYEYAIEPEVVLSWGEKNNARIFRSSFGLGQPRLMSAFPSRGTWKKLFGKALESNRAKMDDLDIMRATEKASQLIENSVVRQNVRYQYDGKTWLTNAVIENLRHPFQAVVASSNPSSSECVILAKDLELENIPQWDVRRAATPNRTVSDIAKELAPMLRIADEIVIVDPYFRAQKPDRRAVLEGLFDQILFQRSGEPPKSISVLVSAEYENVTSLNAFNAECREKMARHIGKGLIVTFARLLRRDRGEKLHNRYVLTNHGGVSLGNTFEQGDVGTMDDANLMDAEQFITRARQYFPTLEAGCFKVPGFDIEDGSPPIRVIGTKP